MLYGTPGLSGIFPRTLIDEQLGKKKKQKTNKILTTQTSVSYYTRYMRLIPSLTRALFIHTTSLDCQSRASLENRRNIKG